MNLIATVDKNWAIGKQGHLLVNIPEDIKLFRMETAGKAAIMGRKTYEQITYISSDLYDATFSSASSTECTTTTPSFLYDKSLVSTTLYLSIRAVLSVICSYVFLPIIAAFPAVSIRKSLISSEL